LTQDAAKSGIMGRLSQMWAKPDARNQLLGLCDQVVVSAMNFVALIVVARNSPLREVGFYVLANTILFMLMALQDSIINRPFAVRLMKPAGSATEHAGSALLLTLIMMCLVLAAAVIAGLGIDFGEVGSSLPIMIGVAAFTILLREFARRHAFLNYIAGRALKLDLLSSAVALVALFGFARSGTLTAATALFSLGLGSALAVGIWWLRHAKEFSFSRNSFNETVRQSWLLGKWFAIVQTSMQLQGYTNQWLILFMLGAAVTGTYGEAMSVVAIANPFIYGILNILMPKSVRKLHHEGRASLLRHTRSDMIGIGAMMALFVLAIAFFGRQIFELLYAQADAPPETSLLMTLLALGTFFGAVGGPLTISLQSEERGKELTVVALMCLVFAVVSSTVLIHWYGMVGAGVAYVATEMFSLALRSYLMFVRVANR
jgi:O-antigen/teichoic acid export membrane protein